MHDGQLSPERWWHGAWRLSRTIEQASWLLGLPVAIGPWVWVQQVGPVPVFLVTVVAAVVGVLSWQVARVFDLIGRPGWVTALPLLDARLRWIGLTAAAGAVAIAVSAWVLGQPLAVLLGVLPLLQAAEPLADGRNLRSAGTTIAEHGLDLDTLHTTYRRRVAEQVTATRSARAALFVVSGIIEAGMISFISTFVIGGALLGSLGAVLTGSLIALSGFLHLAPTARRTTWSLLQRATLATAFLTVVAFLASAANRTSGPPDLASPVHVVMALLVAAQAVVSVRAFDQARDAAPR